MKKKILIFDLDGTLLDTLGDLMNATNTAISEYGFPMRSYEEIKSFVGNGVAKLVARCLPNQEENPLYQKCLDRFTEIYQDHYDELTKPYDGIVDLLKKLKEEGYILILVSNKLQDVTKHLVDKFFPSLFDAVQGDIEGMPKKPAKEVILAPIAYLGLDVSDGIVIGDSDVDYQMASNVGIKTILVTWGFKSKEYLEKFVSYDLVDNANQLYDSISRWSKENA